MSDTESLNSFNSVDSVDSGKVVYYKKTKKNVKHEIPIYDGKETMTNYLRRVEDFTRNINREKYNLILNFINDWFGNDTNKFTTLVDFKNVPEDVLLNKKKPNHNRKIIKKYYNKIISICNLDLDEITDDTDQLSDVIFILEKSLKSINYSLRFVNKYVDLEKKIKIYYIKKNN